MIGVIPLLLIALADSGATEVSEALRRPLVAPECTAASSDTDSIVVCGRRADDGRRYRVADPDAPFDPRGTAMSVARERARWIEHGDTGIGSCSAVGPGGFTGCMLQQWRRDSQQDGAYR